MKAADIYNHYMANKTRPLNFAGADEMELEAALKQSMATFEAEDRQRGVGPGGQGGDDGGGMVGSVLNRGRAGAAAGAA